MFFLGVVVSFGIACSLAWLLLFSTSRESLLISIRKIKYQLLTSLKNWGNHGSTPKTSYAESWNIFWRARLHQIKQHRLIAVIAASVLFFPPVIALVFSSKSMLGTYEDSGREVNTQIASLLQGEQLVPPPPLPPEVFTTAAATLQRPMLVNASRNWDQLDVDFTQLLLLTFKIMKEKYGYDMAIIEGYRSPERQNMLASMGSNVTGALAFQSYHQYGLAADSAFMRDGKLVISEKDPWAMRGYELYGQVAESVGLTWGGRWKMMDFGHVEYRKPGFKRKTINES